MRAATAVRENSWIEQLEKRVLLSDATAVYAAGTVGSAPEATASPAVSATGPVTDLTASRLNATTVTLSFVAPNSGTNYVITRSTSLGGQQSTLTPAGGQTSTSYTDTNAPTTNDTDYYYTVTSVNSGGSSSAVTTFVGHGEGWAASYYTSRYADPYGTGNYKPLTGDDPTGVLSFERIDATISVPPTNTPSGWNSIQPNVDNDFAIRWVGYVEAPITGYYSFGVEGVDDREQITVYDPNHLTNGSPTPVNISPATHTMGGFGDTYTVPVVGTDGAAYAFTAGQKYLVQIDYNQGYGGLAANLYWSASSTTANQAAGTYDLLATAIVPTDDVVPPAPAFSTIDASGTVTKDQSFYSITAAVQSGEVILNWNNVSADSYNVYRAAASGGPYTLIGSVAASTNGAAVSYTDTTVTNGQPYFYLVTGVDDGGETPINLSTGVTSGLTISATPQPTAPASPTNVVAGGINTKGTGIAVHVVFPAVTYATSYIIQRAPETTPGSGIAGAWATVPGGGDVTGSGTISFTDTDPALLSTANYFYRVIAANTLQSAPSAAVELHAVGAALATEGTVQVDVQAGSYSAGSVSSIVNFGNAGGAFNAVGGAISVGDVTDDNSISSEAFEFNGTNAATSSFLSPADLDGNYPRSIEVWVDNPTLDDPEESMVSWSHRGGPNGTNESFSYGTSYGVGQWGGTGYDLQWTNTVPGVTGTGAPSADSWHYLVFTYNGSSDSVYVDGKLYLQQSVASGGLSTSSGFPINLGAQNAATSSGFIAALQGSLDLASVRIEYGTLTAADVANNYAAGIPGEPAPPPTGVVAQYSGSSIALRWNAATGASTYNVYRGTAPGAEGAAPIATGIASDSFLDSTVATGVTYYYEVTAVNSAGLESVRSFEVTARVPTPTNVIITELQASNSTTLTDAAGDSPDWLELYNPTSSTINLGGDYLTDKTSDLTRWAIPAINIAPGQFLVIFCDGANSTSATAEPHTDFSLAASGGYVGLVASDGTTVLSSITYPQQIVNGAYGIAMETTTVGGSLVTSYGATGYLEPTPGAMNGSIIATGMAAQPTVSNAGGIETGPVTLSMSDATPGASIYYTLDGSLPSATNGTLYTGPLTITSETALRAVAVAPGDVDSFPNAATFIYTAQVITQDADGSAPPGWPTNWGDSVAHYGMNPAVTQNPQYKSEIQQDLLELPTVSLTMSLSDLFDPATGIYSNPSMDGNAWTREASVQYIPDDGSAGFTATVGIAIKGDASTESLDAKHGFRLEFSGGYGESELEYPLFGSGGAQVFEEVDLRTDENNSWQYQTPQEYIGIRDEFSDATLAALGQPAQRYQICYLYINGVFWGLYDLVERTDANWAANTFGGSASDYDVIKSGGVDNDFEIEATDGTLTAWNQLYSDMSTLDFSNNANYEMIQGNNPDGTPNPNYPDLLDVNNLVQYILMIDYTGNLDAPNSALVGPNNPNNFYAIRNTDGSDGFIFVATDSEFTLLDVSTNRVNSDTSTVTEPLSNPQYFFQQLESNALFKRLVGDDIEKDFYNNGPMSANASLPRFKTLVGEMQGPVVEESARWGDTMDLPPYTDDTLATAYTYTRDLDWQPLINSIETSYLPQRSGIVVGQLQAAGLFPSIFAPQYSQFGGTIAAGFNLTISNPNSSGSIYYTLDGSDPENSDGTLSSTAILYAGAIPLSTTTEVKARILSGTTWSALTDATFDAPITGLAVTELSYDPATPTNGYASDDDEFIELKNFGSHTINLQNAAFTNGITFTFGDVTLAPGQVGVVVSNAAAFAAEYGNDIDVLGSYQSSETHFNNSGEEVTLVDATGQSLADFTYSSAWYPITAGGGPTLEVVNPGSDPNLNLASSWRPSPQDGGTPGVDDSIPTAPPTGLGATFTNQQVLLQWSAVAGAASYDIYRGIVSGGENATPLATGITGNSFVDTTAVGGSTYYYTVAAVDPGGVSAPSTEASVSVPTTPAPPVIVTQPLPQIVAVGSIATFTAAASGYPVPTTQWYVRTPGGTWAPLAGATSSTYSVVATPNLDGNQYQAVFTNSQGTATTAVVSLATIAAPITAWNFDTSDKTGAAIPAKKTTSPDPSTGAGTASSLGMALVSGPDASNILDDPGSSDGASSTQQAWRIVGNNGWSSTAPIGSQGAQFMVSTVGYQAISLQFDLDVTSQGEGNLAVEYTLNGGSSWLLAPSLSANGAGGISVETNTSSSNTVQGEYFNAYNAGGNEVWYNRLTADFSGVAGAANNPNFGIRLVNASTGADCVNLSGNALNNTSGNWRFDQVNINGAAMAATAATYTINLSSGNLLTPAGIYFYGGGSDTLIISGGSGAHAIDLSTTQLTYDNDPIIYTGASQLQLMLGGGDDSLSLQDNASLTLPAGPAGGGITIDQFSALTIASGAQLTVATPLDESDRAVLVVSNLSIDSARLDLGGNDMDVTGGNLGVIDSYLAGGMNSAAAAAGTGSLWMGEGIASSAAAAGNNMAMGAILNNANGSPIYGDDAAMGLFDGYAAAPNDVLIRYTMYGDANLDGHITTADYLLTDNGFNLALHGWYNGDFNYDGVVNGDDYSLLDNSFDTQTSAAQPALSTASATVATGASAPSAAIVTPAAPGAALQIAAPASIVNTSTPAASRAPRPFTAVSPLGAIQTGLRQHRAAALHWPLPPTSPASNSAAFSPFNGGNSITLADAPLNNWADQVLSDQGT